MTPQEKAVELVENHFKIVSRYEFDTNDKYYEPYQEIAKQCAFIAVDEALSEYVKGFNKMKQLHPYMLDVVQSKGYNYWQQVKHEIEKL